MILSVVKLSRSFRPTNSDGTPMRKKSRSSPTARQLVALFDIKGDTLYKDVVRTASLPDMVS